MNILIFALYCSLCSAMPQAKQPEVVYLRNTNMVGFVALSGALIASSLFDMSTAFDAVDAGGTEIMPPASVLIRMGRGPAYGVRVAFDAWMIRDAWKRSRESKWWWVPMAIATTVFTGLGSYQRGLN